MLPKWGHPVSCFSHVSGEKKSASRPKKQNILVALTSPSPWRSRVLPSAMLARFRINLRFPSLASGKEVVPGPYLPPAPVGRELFDPVQAVPDGCVPRKKLIIVPARKSLSLVAGFLAELFCSLREFVSALWVDELGNPPGDPFDGRPRHVREACFAQRCGLCGGQIFIQRSRKLK